MTHELLRFLRRRKRRRRGREDEVSFDSLLPSKDSSSHFLLFPSSAASPATSVTSLLRQSSRLLTVLVGQELVKEAHKESSFKNRASSTLHLPLECSPSASILPPRFEQLELHLKTAPIARTKASSTELIPDALNRRLDPSLLFELGRPFPPRLLRRISRSKGS